MMAAYPSGAKKMSAYLVTPEHIANLVGWATMPRRNLNCYNMQRRRHVFGDERVTRKRLAEILAEANLASVKARYPDHPDMWRDDYVDDCIRATERAHNGYLTAADIWNMAVCLDYQSCEVGSWSNEDAYWVIRAIKDEASRVMAASARIKWCYDEAEWADMMAKEREKIREKRVAFLSNSSAVQ
jgi:hypothetical protein